MVRSKVKSVRMGPLEDELIRQEADIQDIPAAQFIRDAAVARAIWLMARRRAEPGETWDMMVKLIAAVQVDDADVLEVLGAALMAHDLAHPPFADDDADPVPR